jgi:hypothetical protein
MIISIDNYHMPTEHTCCLCEGVLIVPESVLPAAVEKRGSVTAVMHEEINVLIVDRMITQKCQPPNLHPSQHPRRKRFRFRPIKKKVAIVFFLINHKRNISFW